MSLSLFLPPLALGTWRIRDRSGAGECMVRRITPAGQAELSSALLLAAAAA
jgi:hypothetical protein